MATIRLTNIANGKTTLAEISDLSKKYINDFKNGNLSNKHFLWYLDSKCTFLNDCLRKIEYNNISDLRIEVR